MKTSVVRAWLLVLLSAVVMGSLYASPDRPSTSFTADYVATEGRRQVSSGSYAVSPTGTRMENSPSESERHITIINYAKGVLWMVMVNEGMYMELPLDEGDWASDIENVTVTGSSCPATATESRLGQETLNGRRVAKIRCQEPDGEVMTMWIDERLQWPVRTESDGTVFELSNINETRVPDSRFEVPAGYTKFQMPGMPGMPGGVPGGMPGGMPSMPSF